MVGGSAPLYKKEEKEDKKQVAKFPKVGYPRTGKLAGARKLVPRALGSGGYWPGYWPPRPWALVNRGRQAGWPPKLTCKSPKATITLTLNPKETETAIGRV